MKKATTAGPFLLGSEMKLQELLIQLSNMSIQLVDFFSGSKFSQEQMQKSAWLQLQKIASEQHVVFDGLSQSIADILLLLMCVRQQHHAAGFSFMSNFASMKKAHASAIVIAPLNGMEHGVGCVQNWQKRPATVHS